MKRTWKLLSQCQDALVPFFGAGWLQLGFPLLFEAKPFVLVRSPDWQEMKEDLDGSPSLFILDYLARKEQGCLRE